RHQVVPVLKELNPALPQTLAGNLEVLGAEDAWLATSARDAFAPLVRHEEPGLLAWEEAGFGKLPVALQRRALAMAYDAVVGSRRGLSFERIERMRAPDLRALDLGAGLRLVSEHGLRWLAAPFEAPEPVWAEPGLVVDPWRVCLEVGTPDEAGPLGPDAVAFDADRLRGPLEWRTARPRSDRFAPWGHQQAHSLERFLAKEHVPTPLRERLLVLAMGDEVVWVVGLRRSHVAPIHEGTRWALIARHDKQTWFDRGNTDPYHD
ncbi:MAG TPA: tRNA lysidine(34) synthetase TilS C-terminal domain-containing protein, partial [Stenomitos sp.]